jgi:hypothetical protein
MSPNNQNQNPAQQQNTFSPWTESFQMSPLHREGQYHQTQLTNDPTQAPTRQALSAIYDPTHRE